MNNFNFLKATRIALIVFALTFSTNMNAATPVAFGGGWFSDLIKEIKNIFKGGGHHGGGHHGGGHHGGGQHGGGQHGGGDAVPLDGGLGILLLGAAAFGVKKLRENKNEEA